MAIIKTVKIRSEVTASGYIIINESDYDAKKHTLYETPPQPDIEKPPLALEVSDSPTEKKTAKKSTPSVEQT